MCVSQEGKGGGGVCGRLRGGMCSLNQESPGAEAERSTSLPREGERARLDRLFCFYQQQRSCMGKESGLFNMSLAADETRGEGRMKRSPRGRVRSSNFL